MSDPSSIVFTVKELLQRLDDRMMALDSKLDLRLVSMDERIMHIERVQAERGPLVEQFHGVQKDVERLKTDMAGRKAVSGYTRLWLSMIPVAALGGYFLRHLDLT